MASEGVYDILFLKACIEVKFVVCAGLGKFLQRLDLLAADFLQLECHSSIGCMSHFGIFDPSNVLKQVCKLNDSQALSVALTFLDLLSSFCKNSHRSGLRLEVIARGIEGFKAQTKLFDYLSRYRIPHNCMM